MTHDHPDILQNIEFVLVTAHREDPSIDDVAVLSALRAALFANEPTEARAQDILARLAGTRQFRADVDDRLWKDGLRVVIDSVRTHSDLRAGSTGYLDFVSGFVG